MRTSRFVAAGALSVAAAVVLALHPPAFAASRKPHHAAAAAPASGTLGSAGAWTAYASSDKTGRVCYLVGKPQKSEANGVARKDPAAMVTHRPAEHIANVVSFVEGYPLKEGSEVALQIGDRKFALFTNDDSGWARTSDLDREIVATLGKATSAVVKGEPQKGRPTVDVYALAGFSRALALIDKACGVKREETHAPAPRPHKPARRPRHSIATPHP